MNWQNAKNGAKDVLVRYYYARTRYPKHWGWLPSEETTLNEMLYQLGITVQELVIDVDRYKDYFANAGYATRYPQYYSWNITEKSLEHFVAQSLLKLNPTDVYVDIASEGSPVPEIYSRLYGCTTYAQDLSYESGMHGNKIGSNASSLPLSDESVSKIALHCSFEHFEGESDSGFIREAARVLRVGGKLVIVPLYLAPRYSIATDPLVSRLNLVSLEPDAVVMVIKGWANRHGRFYDPQHLLSRVLTSTDGLDFTLMRLVNAKEVNESVYARFVLVGTKIAAKK